MSDECKCGFDHWPLSCKEDDAPKELAASSFAAPAGSLPHVWFELHTEQGNAAMIKGDPNMPEATRKALATMIDAVMNMQVSAKQKQAENDGTEATARE